MRNSETSIHTIYTISNVGNLIYFKELEIILGSSSDYKNEKFKTKQKNI